MQSQLLTLLNKILALYIKVSFFPEKETCNPNISEGFTAPAARKYLWTLPISRATASQVVRI